MSLNLNETVTRTPARQRPLSLELQQVIEEKNLLNTDARCKVISALSEINGHEALHSSLRSRATQEILSSELSYVKQLENVMKFFMEPIKQRELMSSENFATIFGQIETVYRVAGALVAELQACKNDNLAPAFVRLAPFLKMYSVYACGYQKASETLQNLRSGKHGLALHTFLQGQESRPEVGCTLQALLIAPVQRLPRYRLLLKEVASHTADDDQNLETLQEALKGVEVSAAHVDALLSEQEQLQRLFDLQESLLDNWPQVIKPGRTFLKEGSFMKVAKCGTKAVQVHLILLSDMFLCCRVRSGQLDCRYAFPLDRSSIENVLGQAVFKISCGTETLLLFAKNQDDGELWTGLMQKTINELKACRQTLKKHTSKKRLPKRIEDLEEGAAPSSNLFTRTLRKRKQSSPSSSTTSLNSKKFRSSARYLSRLTPSPPKDSLYPLRKQQALKAHKTLNSSPSCFSSKKKNAFDWSKVESKEEAKCLFSEKTDKSTEEKEAEELIIEKNQATWSKHCIDLVRNVANLIRSAFKP
ncbi:FYVE, RhoGEF and PH domain-containing protein 2-like [Neocloeon triangulifer]|uniref:FYVE, RhoGEF and PH domain-containing protein 2-like n=1 Tax=Neocloeon triangulifer TaxID=2078957 RepID=UPI00286F74A2|nr:FYVE, RhoGEF and PH domain-containing protein 2-like [Neocloeon triangulifer]